MPKQRPRSNYRDLPYGAGTVRKRGDGWEARWSEGDERKGKMFATEAAAHQFLYERWVQKKQGTYRQPSELTVSELAIAWLERNRDNWSPNTYSLNRYYLDAYVAPALGSVKAVDLDPARMQYMVDTMRKAGRSPSVIRATVRIISTTYRQAIVLKIVTENPATGIVLPRYTPAARDTWTADDIDKILTTLRTDAKWMAVYRLCLATGIRPGEMLALKWADLDLANGRVTIRRTVTRTADRKLIIGTKTKTDKDRTIALSSSVIAALKAWRPQQVAERLAAKSWSDNDLILAGTKGELMHPSTWWRYHRDLCERAGVKRIALHSLRHTFATIALERNIHPKIVQEMLGHASIQITLDLYTHLSVDLQSAAAESLDAHLFGIQDQQKGIT